MSDDDRERAARFDRIHGIPLLRQEDAHTVRVAAAFPVGILRFLAASSDEVMKTLATADRTTQNVV